MGCWVSYGLGSMNENLPTFVVLPDHRGFASNGTEELGLGVPAGAAPGHGHLPRHRRRRSPTCSPPAGRVRHAAQSDAAGIDAARRSSTASTPPTRRRRRLEARIRSYELAARMQLAAPEALDISQRAGPHPEALRPRPRAARLRQGDQRARRDRHTSAASAWSPGGCWSAACASCRSGRGNDNGFPRRNWDSHEDIAARPRPAGRRHGPRRRGADHGPQAARPARRHDRALDDRVRPHALQRRGARAATTTRTCFTNWLAGGGIKGGISHGPSDEWGYKPADRDNPTQVYDIHATILHLLGIDHTKLTVRHNGIDRRLTDVHGHVIDEILA